MNDAQAKEFLKTLRQELRTEHFMIIGILGCEHHFPFAYTVGMSRTLGFELYMIGLDNPQYTEVFLNRVGERLLEEPIPDLELINGIASVPFRLKTYPFNPEELGPLITAMDLTPPSIRVLEWPDKHGRWPGDFAYSAECPQTPLCIGRTTATNRQTGKPCDH